MAGGDYARIRLSFWTDPDIKKPLAPEQKLLLLYYFSNPRANMIGLYYSPFMYAASETGLPLDKIEEWTKGPLARFVTFDDATEEVLVHRGARHQVGDELKAGDNRVRAVHRELAEAHSPALVQRFFELYPDWPIHSDEGAGKGLPSPSEALTPAPAPAPAETPAPATHQQGPGEGRSAGRPAGEGAKAPDDGALIAEAAIRAANAGMLDNPNLGDGAFRPIAADHSPSHRAVAKWIQSGIAAAAILEEVYHGAANYKKQPRKPQIVSLAYFDVPVSERHELDTSRAVERPTRKGARTDPAPDSEAARVRSETPGRDRQQEGHASRPVPERLDTIIADMEAKGLKVFAEKLKTQATTKEAAA